MSPASKSTKGVVVRRVTAPTPTVQAPDPSRASLKLYRRIAIGFVLLVLSMLGSVVYLSTMGATIEVVPVEQVKKAEFLADVAATPTKESEIRGRVIAVTLGETQTFTPSGQGKKTVEGTSRGTVTIVNTSSKAQPLVATTRLLSPEGVLFRIDKTVTAPAGGTVTVEAYADQPGATGDVGPTTFTIPGLSESLQKVIYAKNDAAFSGGSSEVSVVSQSDLDASALTLRSALEDKAKAQLRTEAGDGFAGESFSSTVVSQTSSVQAGTEVGEYTLTMSVQSVGVFYDQQALVNIATRKLYEQLSQGEMFVGFDASKLQAVVSKYDVESGKANVRVYLDGTAIPSLASESLDPGRFVGMTEEQVRTMLVDEETATDVSVDFRPFWATHVPRLKDHITIQIHP